MAELIHLHPENLGQANWQQPGEASLPVLSVRQIRLLEEAAFRLTDSFLLMQAAGIRSAIRIADKLGDADHQEPTCLVLAGPGNNGGDGCIVAGELKRRGYPVKLIQVTEGRQGSKDRMQAVLWAMAQGVEPVEFQLESGLPAISPGVVVIDALLGIACDRAPTGQIQTLIQLLNAEVRKTRFNNPAEAVRVFALDCPSGLNCDTGTAPGEAIQADATFTYLACKQGLLTGQGKRLSGEILVEGLSCEGLLQQMLQRPGFELHATARGQAEQLLRLPQRGHEHHKGSFG
ncbi:MAG TPA: NAD(P)H-hydrate epimerase, partial [Limnobacter sp.]|nr:NAD(P)H-hydrate epimerase [Limnobacter sp.]